MYGFVLSSLRRVKRDGGLAESGVVPSGCIWLVLSTSTSITRGQAAEHFVVVFIHQAGLLPGDISGIAQDRGLSLRLGHGFELL